MNELTQQIEYSLKELTLKSILESYEEVAEKASKSNLSYLEYLALLLEKELKLKNDNSINYKIHKSKFPFLKTLEEFDFSFQPNIKEKELLELSSLLFIEQKSNVIFLGPPGVGKTHLSISIGIKACLAKYRVLFITLQKLLEDLSISEKEGNLASRLLFYSRLQLLIIDELGYMPISKIQANLFFQLISSRYERGSIILTSNFNFEDWGNVFDDSVAATAIIDRIVHHSHIFYINGNSYRIKDKIQNK